jgi:hypothetical protein
MKRSPALISLSRDHHRALDVARRPRPTGGRELNTARDHLRRSWEPRGRRHFETEEDVLLGAVDASDADWAAAARRVGRLLLDHVRFEERTLFALLQARLSEKELRRLGEALDRESHRTA